MKKPWTKFKEADTVGPDGERIFVNSRYQVQVDHAGFGQPFGEVMELSIKRLDKQPIFDWRDVQRIKNELIGKEATGIQVFPPESNLVDTANQYYIFVFTEYQLPFGFKQRVIQNRSAVGKMRQRPFEPDELPEDIEERQREFDEHISRKLKL